MRCPNSKDRSISRASLCEMLRNPIPKRMGQCDQSWEIQVKITKKAQRAVLKDIRKQLVWIEDAIKAGDQNWIDIYANQLAATATSLHSETMSESQHY